MHNIQIGSFILNGQLLMFLLFGLVGWAVLQYRLRHTQERDSMQSMAFNAFWLWLITWKVSFIIFYPVEFINQPISVLYFDGGEFGRWIASVAVVCYIWYASRKQNLSMKIWLDLSVWFITGCWLIYHTLLLVTDQHPAWYYGATVLGAVLFLVILIVSHKIPHSGKELRYFVWFLIGNVLLQFLVDDRSFWLLSFSKQQCLLLIVAIGLIGWFGYADKKQKGSSHE